MLQTRKCACLCACFACACMCSFYVSMCMCVTIIAIFDEWIRHGHNKHSPEGCYKQRHKHQPRKCACLCACFACACMCLREYVHVLLSLPSSMSESDTATIRAVPKEATNRGTNTSLGSVRAWTAMLTTSVPPSKANAKSASYINNDKKKDTKQSQCKIRKLFFFK